MALVRQERNRNLHVRLDEEHFQDVRFLQGLNVNMSELIRMFVRKVAENARQYPLSKDYFGELEEKLSPKKKLREYESGKVY